MARQHRLRCPFCKSASINVAQNQLVLVREPNIFVEEVGGEVKVHILVATRREPEVVERKVQFFLCNNCMKTFDTSQIVFMEDVPTTELDEDWIRYFFEENG